MTIIKVKIKEDQKKLQKEVGFDPINYMPDLTKTLDVSLSPKLQAELTQILELRLVNLCNTKYRFIYFEDRKNHIKTTLQLVKLLKGSGASWIYNTYKQKLSTMKKTDFPTDK